MSRYDRFLSETGRSRVPNILRVIAGRVLRAGGERYINVFAGMPNPAVFPIVDVSCTLRDGTVLTVGEDQTKVALQYGSSEGQESMRSLIRELVVHFHNPPRLDSSPTGGDTSIIATSGSSDALDKVFNMILDRGDYLLMEEYSYPGVTASVQGLGVKPLLLKVDEHGVIPDSLRAHMSRWSPDDVSNPESDIPKLIYVIPSGQNPTGATLTLERRHEIYQIAREYDLLILEDDPYYLMCDDQVPSFLSMDEDGRVLRAESFSKTIAAGLRCGYIVGPAPLIAKYVNHVEVSTNGVSGVSQVIICALFKHWGMDGFLQHIEKVRLFYKARRDVMTAAAARWLTGKMEWSAPSGGMFLWLKCKLLKDTEHLATVRGVAKEVLFVPGSAFSPLPSTTSDYIRLSFAYATPSDIEKAIKVLAELIDEEVADMQ